MSNSKAEAYVVRTPTLQAAINYLASCPYNDVAGFLPDLLRSVPHTPPADEVEEESQAQKSPD